MCDPIVAFPALNVSVVGALSFMVILSIVYIHTVLLEYLSRDVKSLETLI